MTYTFPLTLDEAAQLLRQSVEKRGEDYVYEPPGGEDTSCLYWHKKENAPGCGVGDVLFTAGVPAEVLKTADIHTPRRDVEIHKNPILRLYVDGDAISYLYAFQREQDERATWGEALEAAEKMRERLIELHY